MKKIINLLMNLFVVLCMLLGTPALQAVPIDPDPFDAAQFISQSVPSSMISGQTYTVSITMRNAGNTRWTNIYQLVSTDPEANTTWGTQTVQVASDVARNAQYTFTFNVVAPQAAGNYNFQWQMQGDGAFGTASTNQVISVTPSQNANNSAVTAQSVPATMIAGRTYPVSVTMRNDGATTWTSGANYKLGSLKLFGDLTPGAQVVALPNAVAPGQSVTFSFNVTAPSVSGYYGLQWSLVQAGVEWFGPRTADLSIYVAAPQASDPPPAPPAPPAPPTPAVPDKNRMAALMAIINMMLDDDTPAAPPAPPPPPAPPTPPAIYDGPVVIGDLAQLNNADAGALPGTMGVGNGATTYSLPIALPPGVVGVQPSLSLNYSGTNSSGVAGLGWSIGGGSNIDRCGRNFAVNNTTDVARFLPADRLCLDGQQLILINGDNNNDGSYWSEGAEYRTEIDGFSRIRAALTNGHRSFTVETKGGQTLTYGDRNDTYLIGQGRTDSQAHRWWLSGSIDRSGNTIGYWYSADGTTGESRLTAVRWGGNTRSGQSNFAKSELVYETRPDAHAAYVAGSHFDERLRLQSIVTSTDTQADGSGGTVALRYNLAYETSASSGRSLLKTVQACDAGGACLPATTFDWGKKNPNAPHAFVSLGGVRQGPNLEAMASGASDFTNSTQGMLAIGDFNGDGKADILERYRVAANGYEQRLFLSNADGNGWTVSYPMTGIPGHVMEIGDFNGDGQLDLLVANQPAGQYAISNWRLCHSRLSTGEGFVCSANLSFPTDAFNTFSPQKPARKVLDYNGDGKDDLFLSGGTLYTDKKYKCLSTGSAFNCAPIGSSSEDLLSGNLSDNGHLGGHPDADMDGDGRSDYVLLESCRYELRNQDHPNSTLWVCPVSTAINIFTPPTLDAFNFGSGWFNLPNNHSALLDPATSGVLTSDFNADGLSDIVFGVVTLSNGLKVTATNGHVCYSTGGVNGDCHALPSSGTGFNHEVVTVGDFDGDGVVDVLRPNHDTWDTYNITGYQLCHIGSDATSHTCEAWTGPVFYTNSDSRKYIVVPVQGYFAQKESLFSGDFNGDGKQDIVSYLGGSNWEISGAADQAMPGQAIDQLMSATNGLGLVEKVEYATVNDAAVYQDVAYDINGQAIRPAYPVKRAPVTRQLVKSFSRGNGQGGWLTSRYQYAGNANDGSGRGNLGFARQDVTDAQTGHVTTTWLRQDFPYIGMVAAALTNRVAEAMPVSGNYILGKTLQTLSHNQVAQPNGRITRFPFVQSSTTWRRDLGGQDMGETTTTNDYGAYGNLRESSITASVAGGDTFTSQSVNVYASDEANWRLADLSSTVETKTSSYMSVVRRMDYTYDTQGLLVAETRQGNDVNLKLVTTYNRLNNWSGLVNKVTQQWYDPASGTMQSRVLSEVEYDNQRRFPIWKKNALGQLESYTHYDPATGALKRRVDINGLVYTQAADAFGRQRSETAPDGNETRSYQKVCDASCPAGAVAISITDHIKGGQRSALPTLVYSDSAGHVLRTQSWGFDGRVVTADMVYDARGRVFETYWPRLAGAASVLASQTAYDDLNRVTGTVTINDGGAAIASGTEYKGLQTVLTNANGQSKTDTRDVRGKLWKSVDAAGTTYYAHDPYGNLFQTSDPAGNVITVGYDALGRRTGLADPDLGSIQYDVDALGRTWRQVSPLQRAASTATTMTYDLLDRMVKRTEPDLISYWDYELMAGQSDCQALKSCGKLVDAHTTDLTGKVDYRRQHSFDALGRPDTTATYLDKVYYVSSSYDNWGRPLTQTLSRQGGATKQYTQHYNARGYVERIDRGAAPLWWATAQDAANRVTNAALGNGMTIGRDYNPYTGHLSFGGLNNAQNQGQLSESYNYDALGNVLQRAQYWPDAGFTEGFEYDGLNRLSGALVAGLPLQSFRYNAIGNLLAKTGVGEYVYPPAGAARPHAVQAIPGIGDFYYDGNGNLLAGAGRTVAWTSFDMPRSISKGGDSSVFMYGPEHQRARQERSDGTATYYAGAMEAEINNGAVTVKTYWPMGLGVEIDKPDGSQELNWTHLDRLGSVVAISDAAGNLKERLAYDSWGKRRTINGEATPDSLDGVTDNRGFTGHEMLDKLDLVHMNGRVYDPLVARFISADPIIQDPEHSQSYNRYTYVWNNPTNLTDPTGFAALTNDKEKLEEELPKPDPKERPANSVIPVNQDSRVSQSKDTTGVPLRSATSVVKTAVDGTRDFIDGGYGEKTSQAIANGKYGNAAAYTVAGAIFGVMNVVSVGEAGAIANATKAVGTELVAGQGGRFAELVGVVGDDLTAHHMPQAALKFTSKADGGAVVLTTAEHEATRTYFSKGSLTKVQDAALSFRDVLAKDIHDLRSIVGSRYNEGVKGMLKYYKEKFPDLMKKD